MPTQSETTERDLVTEVEDLLNDVGFRGDFETVSRPLLRRLVEEVEKLRAGNAELRKCDTCERKAVERACRHHGGRP